MNTNYYEDLIDKFIIAWNSHDIDALMDMMTDNCVYHAAAGNINKGNTYSGQEEVRKSYQDIFDIFPDATWIPLGKFVHNNRGLSEWRFTGTKTNNEKTDVMGCDLFKFENGKILVKDSYRKQILNI